MEGPSHQSGQNREPQKGGQPRRTHRTSQMSGRQPVVAAPKPVKKGFLDQLREKVARHVAQWLVEHALPPEGASVLEAGSGPADGTSALKESKAVALAVAIDLKMARLQSARDRDPNLCLVRGDLFRLPFKSGSFDLVWSHSALEHIHDKRRTIYEMVHAAKPGGRVFVGVPYNRGPLSWLSWIPSVKLQKRIGNLFDEQALAIDIEGTGLALEQFMLYHHKMFLACLARKSGE